MKLPLVALLLIGTASAVHLTPEVRRSFEEFQVRFNRNYTTRSELRTRMAIFAGNLRLIEAHNRQSGIQYKMGINRFADYTDDEFKSYVSGYSNIAKPEPSVPAKHTTKDIMDLPAAVDWRYKGIITDVKDQGSCGSCWALTTGTTKRDVTLVEISKQCGITGKCNFNAEAMERAAYIRGYETLPRNDVAVVMQHLAKVGPLGIAVDAWRWKLYTEGVFNDCSYDENIQINHAVQLVGYGTDDVQGNYWLIRNTWGADWGEEGYIRLKRENSAVCGTDSSAGIACENDGSTIVKVCGMCGMLSDSSYPIGAGNVNAAIP